MKIAVYCGSSPSKRKEYEDIAVKLGSWIGRNGHTLVYGGGEAGLMGTVSKAAYDEGTDVIGVVPENVGFISSRPQPYVTELIKAADMSERKKTMMEISDVFVALPGGIGTLDEISEAITMVRIGTYNKPCVFINTSGFYEPVKALFSNMSDAGFVESTGVKGVLFSDDINEIEQFILNFK